MDGQRSRFVRWKITLVLSGEEGDQNVVLARGATDRDANGEPSEGALIAAQMARTLASLAAVGAMVPCPGQDILEAFGDEIEDCWPIWNEEPPEESDDSNFLPPSEN